LASDSRPFDGPRPSMMRVSYATSDSKHLSAEMTANLSAELEGRVPPGLVAEVVRAVLDESRQVTQDWAAEPTMHEARQRLERFVRARASR